MCPERWKVIRDWIRATWWRGEIESILKQHDYPEHHPFITWLHTEQLIPSLNDRFEPEREIRATFSIVGIVIGEKNLYSNVKLVRSVILSILAVVYVRGGRSFWEKNVLYSCLLGVTEEEFLRILSKRLGWWVVVTQLWVKLFLKFSDDAKLPANR